MINSKEIKNTIIAEITEIIPTYEDSDIFHVFYRVGDKCGQELVEKDSLGPYDIGHKVSVEDKLSVEICNDELKELIEKCRVMECGFIEIDTLEAFNEKLIRIKNEVSELDKKYKQLKISEYFIFIIDENGSYMSIDTAITTRFLF